MTSGNETTNPSPTRRAGPSRLRRWLIIVAVSTPALLVVAAFIATRSWPLKMIASSLIESKLGGEVRIGRARYIGDGTIILQEVRLLTPSPGGEGSEALSIGRAQVGLSFAGRSRLRDVRLDDVRLRLTEDADHLGRFNVSSLEPQWKVKRSGDPLLPPSIEINNAVVELGVQDDGVYEVVGQRRFSGRMVPNRTDAAWYDFVLEELDAAGMHLGESGLHVSGAWNVNTHEYNAEIDGLIVDERTREMCPRVARARWQLMDPDGAVGEVRIEHRVGQPFRAQLDIEGMALNLPIAASNLFAGPIGDKTLPRMHVQSGLIELVGDELRLTNFIGEFRTPHDGGTSVAMPYSVNLTIRDLPPFEWKNQQEWVEAVRTVVPFEMKVRMDDFSLAESSDGRAEGIDLPSQVADTIQKFNLRDWTLTTEVDVTRGPPVIGTDEIVRPAEVHTNGQAYISEASGAFEGFPYPLENVNAFVQFDNEKVVVHYLEADGAGDATLRMSGTISPPGKTAAISLKLVARNLPLDDRFRQALKGGQLATFDRTLHKESYARIEHLGLLPDAAAIERARARRRELSSELATLKPDQGPRRAAITRELDRLDTVIEADSFELGGIIDLDFQLERARGLGKQPEITGKVTVQRAGVVYQKFPYPIYVMGGQLTIEPGRVIIDAADGLDGIPIVTPGGGRGVVVGEVAYVRENDVTRVQPQVAFELRGDALSNLLYVALPLDRSKAGEPPPLLPRLLAGAGLSGRLNHSGTITANDAGEPVFEIAVEMLGGAAEPQEAFFEGLREIGLPAPRGLHLDGVEALMRVTPQSIDLLDFTGHQEDAVITAEGHFALRRDRVDANITVNFNNLALERYMIDLTPGATERTAMLWDRYQPEGRYDARLHFRTEAGEATRPELTLQPRKLIVQADGRPVTLECESGDLIFHSNQVNFEDFVLRVESDSQPEGVILLDGSYGLASRGQDLSLRGTWTDGQLGSPIIGEALALIGAEQQVEQYRKHAPHGRFDASFRYQSQRGDAPRDFEFIVQPETLGLTMSGVVVEAVLDPKAQIDFTPGRILLRDLAGTHEDGSFMLDGSVDLTDGIDIDLDVAYRGFLHSDELLAMVPKVVRRSIDSLAIRSDSPIEITDAWVRAIRLKPDPSEALSEEGDEEPKWETAFGGRLETADAAMRASSVDLTEVDGVFVLFAESKRGEPPFFDLKMHADRGRLLGRMLTNVNGTATLSEGGKHFEIPAIRAEAYGGVITGRIVVGMEPGTPYEARIDLAGVSLDGLASEGSAESRDREDEVAPPKKSSDPPRGETYGSLSIAGTKGDPASRRGRGALRVAWGRMASMPVTLRILQVFELSPPISGGLDFADVMLYVKGNRIIFERLFFECPTLHLIGSGEMSYPDLDLDIHLRTRGTIPVVHDIISSISDQLFEVEITGPISDPKARLVPLPHAGGRPPESRPSASQESAPLADATNGSS